MAARNQRTAGSASSGREAHDSFALHARASQHRDDLLEEARELQAAGKIREARGVERRARQVTQLVDALEAETRIGSMEPAHPPIPS